MHFSLLPKKVKRGPSKKCNQEGKGVRYITSENLIDGKLQLDKDYKFLSGFNELEKFKINEGDLLLNCVNSLEMIGKFAVACKIEKDAIVGFNNYAIELWNDYVLPKFADIFFKRYLAKTQIYFLIKRAINQVSFATRELDYIYFHLPSIKEQAWLVNKFEEQFTKSFLLRNDIEKTLLIIKSLKSSILKHAFEGKLVPQDPNDEPASELLKRIKSK